MAHDFDDTVVQSQVFGRPAARDDQRVVIIGLDLVERSVQRKVVSALLTVGLVAFEVVNRGTHSLSNFLVWTDRVDTVAHHQKHLKGNHHFVVLDVVSDQHQDSFRAHR